ncbi:hypothetical protein D3OALGA1CA_5514 [Olavius algarvensis associated proteobacterium Delta 3]|nr:hypothetical protein D3OALGB2SA_1358 [Olavius algarvensis associated proteobacterium Delta 3]CAB5167823.1 hypothetical protein D3OALGA1CA_5514 [Olavius algarvensis associated proteobacterium Delta 3]
MHASKQRRCRFRYQGVDAKLENPLTTDSANKKHSQKQDGRFCIFPLPLHFWSLSIWLEKRVRSLPASGAAIGK